MLPPRFLTAEWRHLVMLNYEVAPDCLRPLIPAGTELDFWNGRTFLSLVGFRFVNTKVLGVPIPFHRDFDEINLRFYVRHRASDCWRRGVVFIKEIVPRWAIAFVARRFYNENYVACRMRSAIQLPDVQRGVAGSAEYVWTNESGRHLLRAEFAGEPKPLETDSEEEFITEHYWGYARQRDGGTVEYRVAHPRWNVWRAASSQFECDVANFYGQQYCSFLAGQPSSAFVADGSPIVVHRGVRIPGELLPVRTPIT